MDSKTFEQQEQEILKQLPEEFRAYVRGIAHEENSLFSPDNLHPNNYPDVLASEKRICDSIEPSVQRYGVRMFEEAKQKLRKIQLRIQS